MNLPVETILLILNIFFILIILICATIGFIRGTLKSGYFFIASILVFTIGWILMGPISESLAYTNLSWLNIEIDGIEIETPMQLVREIIAVKAPDYLFLFEEGSNSLELMNGIVGLVVKVLYYFGLLFAMVTTFYLIFGIVWLICKRPIRKLFCFGKTEKLKDYKVSIFSRLGGLGIGFAKGLMYTLFIGVIFAGIASISSSVKQAVNDMDEVAVVCVNDTFTIVELSSEASTVDDNSSSEYDDIFALLEGYKKTVPGVVFGSIKFGEYDTSFDEFMFDSIFKIDGKTGDIKLRKELKKLAKALSNDAIKEIMSDGFDINKLYQLEEEDLRELVETLSSLDCVKVLIPVGLEFVAYSSLLEEKLGSEFSEIQEVIKEKLPELIAIDYCQEFKNLGFIFVDAIQLLGENVTDLKELDYFNLNQEVINDIFKNLDDMEILEIIAPITISYILNMDSIKDAINDTGFTMEDLGLTSDVDYVKELMNLPSIYEKVVDLGIKRVNGEIDLSEIDPTKVEALVETLFDSTIVSNAVPVVATTLVNSYLPDDYNDIFTKEELENVKWEEEFSPLLSAVAVMLKTDLLTSTDPVESLINLSDETVEELGNYLSQSSIMTDNLNEVIESLLYTVLTDDIKFEGLNEADGEVWDKDEIVGLFNVLKQFSNGLNLELSDSELDKLSENMSNSTYIKKNINNLVEAMTSGIGFEVAKLSQDEWTKNEIFVTFKALNIITNIGNGSDTSIEDLFGVGGEKLDIILESKLIKDSVKQLIIDKTKPGGDFEILKGVYADGKNENGTQLYYWDATSSFIPFNVSSSGIINISDDSSYIKYVIYKNDRYFVSTDKTSFDLNSDEYKYNSNDVFTVKGIIKEGELRNVLDAISKLNVKNIAEFNIDLKEVVENKDAFLNSYIISETIIDQIRSFDSSTITIPNEFMEGGSGLWQGENGELINVIDALDCVLNISNSDEPVYINDIGEKLEYLYINNLSENTEIILKSKIIASTIISKIKALNNNGLYIPNKYLTDDNSWYNVYNENGELLEEKELSYLIKSLGLILIDDSNLESIDLYKTIDSALSVFKNDDQVNVVLKSEIIAYTLVNNVLNIKALNDSDYIKTSFNNYKKNINDMNNWYGFDNNHNPVKKELWNLLKGISLVIGNKSLLNIDNFSIEMLIENDNMKPEYNSNCEIVSSNISIMLQSIVLEEIFAGIASDLCGTGGYLELVINVPSNVNWYRKDVSSGEEYDLQTFLESFFIIQNSFDFTNSSNILNSVTSLKKLSKAEVEKLATGMVISRIFRGSIEKMFNTILYPDYLIKQLSGASLKPWDNIKFVQSNYNGNTRTAARDKFVSTFTTICVELNK